MTPIMQDELTARETAKILGCSRSYLYKLMDAGKLHQIVKPTILKEPRLYFALSEVRKLANEVHGRILSDADIEQLLLK